MAFRDITFPQVQERLRPAGPFAAILDAEDSLIRDGFGRLIASMVAAGDSDE